MNDLPQMITTDDIIFFSEKYIIENSEQCFTVSYASILGTNHESNITNIPNISLYVPRCMFSAFVTRASKKVADFIHFRVECLEYNSVTSTANVKIQMTAFYHSQSTRFKKYLDPLGSYIKLDHNYLISDLIKFSTSGKIMIEVTDIDYLKTLNTNNNMFESSTSTISNTKSIIDIISDDIKFSVKPDTSTAYKDIQENQKKDNQITKIKQLLI
ncbi:28905_t:CDS:1 [Racocetra persica]|uniref:28905_t:CDS:1 n=1 Tax=Racocetra persica TaxID=160502 RepID=A0ACA9MLQ8_9GLOM|nr:28905_t:CDS:1 [Racocetra persica]